MVLFTPPGDQQLPLGLPSSSLIVKVRRGGSIRDKLI
jgi:hypothetical protein